MSEGGIVHDGSATEVDFDLDVATASVSAIITTLRQIGLKDHAIALALLAGANEIARQTLNAEDWAESLRIMAANCSPYLVSQTRN